MKNKPTSALSTPRASRVILGALFLAARLAAPAAAQTNVVTHWELQAVAEDGTSAWVESFPFTIRGVILNHPEDMLSMEFKPDATTPPTGGQFQLFIQAVDAGDRGGTAIFMAQRSPLGDHYEDPSVWESEMARVSYDSTGRKFRAGDIVAVTARKALFYNGKRNINEAHRTGPDNNFDIALVQPNAGLPPPEAIALADLKNADDTAIFDPTRATGGEHWQGMRVRLDGIRLTNDAGWGQATWADRVCWATDDDGRSLLLRMPLTDLGPPPGTATLISAVGILNQEGSNTNGYELFVQEIGPEMEIRTTSSGAPAVSFSADYAGYIVQFSDDGLDTWEDLDATPQQVIVVTDPAASSNRAYRLVKKEE